MTKAGEMVDTDVLVLATGYDCLKSLLSFEIVGEAGFNLADIWSTSPKAYKGICVPGVPNFFVMFGPSTISDRLLFSECAANYASDCILQVTSLE